MFKNYKDKMNNNYRNNNNFNKYGNQKKGKIERVISIEKDEKYINPYNFITLPKECERESFKERKGNLTGYIDCELIAKTPIVIPDVKSMKTEKIGDGSKEFKKYDFFNYEEKSENGDFVLPVIPGSEIRGMLRNDYEVFTKSCMSTLNDDLKLISRTQEIKIPGIIEKDENGNWVLYKAERYRLHTCRPHKGAPKNANGTNEAIYMVDEKNTITINGKKYGTGDFVKFEYEENGRSKDVIRILEPNERNLKMANGGYLFIGEVGVKKDRDSIHDSIFVKKDKVKTKNLNQSVENLKEIYRIYNDKAFNQSIRNNNKVWYDGYNIEKGGPLPVWYNDPKYETEKEDEMTVYLSLASIGKEMYYRTFKDLVGNFMPCVNKDAICKACNMFGFVSDEDSVSSKIRISDAIYEGKENPYDSRKIIKELGGPHIANAAFYALYPVNTQFKNLPQNFDFNYDFKIKKDCKTKIESSDITIRGRKMYWHHDDIENSKTQEKTERNSEVTPVKKETTFKFKIFFENIKEQDLQELIAVAGLKYGKKDLCHKIGKAKPLGYGSCKINVNDVYLKNIKEENGKLKYEMKKYEESQIDLNDVFDMSELSMIEASRIYDFTYIKRNYKDAKVQYPIGINDKNEEGTMHWFGINKSTDLRDPYIIMVLPRIIDGKVDAGEDITENHKEFKGRIIVKDKIIGEVNGLELPKFRVTKKRKDN